MPLEAPESSKGKRKSHPSPEEKRSLRSKDSVPPKSDLEKYFPDFQAVVFGEQEDDGQSRKYTSTAATNILPGLPSPDTVIHIVDELPAAHKLPIRARNDQTSPKGKRASPTAYAISSKQHGPSSRRQNEDKSTGETLDLEALARQWKQANPNIKEDPLPDDHYKSAHKRAERKEKQSRNTDRERAMHEKSELERILGDLKGPDWLRTLGISGITETQKRQLEPKRDHFIQRVKGLLERFATWKDKEKRLKQRRDRRLARQQAQTKEDEGPEDSEDPIDGPSSSTKNYDDASARRPLRQAERKVSEPPAKRTKTSFSPPPEKPFTTFFAKPHLRAAAVGKHRRGRNVFAFGHPVPHMFEADFALPPDYLEETLMKSTKQ